VGLLKKAFYNEQKQFQRLSKQGQKFALSIFLYNTIHPVFAIVTNAFLWRQTQDVMIVALFNLSMFCMLPIGFYLNGQLLKRYSIKKIFFAGAILRAILVASMIFFPLVNQVSIVVFGLLFGFASGLFWSNKNLLNVELTTSSNRMYFSSLDFITQTINNIIIPSAIGALLVFGTNHSLYTPQHGYYIVAVLLIALSFLMGSLIKKINVKTPDISNIILQNGSQQWNCARGITALLGLLTGTSMFLPILIVLRYIGNEDTLGVVQSIAAVVSGIIMYSIARSINTRFRIPMIAASVVTMVIGSGIMAFYFNPTGIFIYFALITVAQQILFAETNSVIYDLIDRENQHEDNKYKYVFDLEMVLNIGRVTGIMFFVFYTKTFSSTFAMQFTPLFFAIALGAIILLAKMIEDRKEAVAQEPAELAESYAQQNNQQQVSIDSKQSL
jgi:MFS transporter, YQGE family, putative transporter